MTKDDILFNQEESTTETSKCPTCGANLKFSPENQTLKCDYCGTEKKIEINLNNEISLSELLNNNQSWAADAHVVRCTNCGSKEVISREDIATSCSFCGTSTVIEVEELAGLKPNAIVPFKISKVNATEIAIKWARKKFFAPRHFKKSITPNEISGTYSPAFTFDANTITPYSGVLGKTTTSSSTVNGRTVTSSTTRYFNISGTKELFYDDILIQASSNINQQTINTLQPFYTNSSHEYKGEFLHGFTAQQYTKDGKNSWLDAQAVMESHTKKSILSGYHYDVIRTFNAKTYYYDITYKYILIPIYIGHYKWKQKTYNFFLNGYTGKLSGKTPVSPWKVSILVGGIIGLVLLAYFLKQLIFYLGGTL